LPRFSEPAARLKLLSYGTVGTPSANAAPSDGAQPDFAVTVASLPPWMDGHGRGVDASPDEVTVNSELTVLPAISQIGRYQLKAQLGQGGLGTVYEAWDPVLSRTVAVKTLQFSASVPERVALDRQFLNEARAVAGLNHPHIVTVYDAGLSAHGVYIAMERLQGRDLRQALASGWRPTSPQAAQLVRRVADALAYAHARGVVHCDIKPANIFLTRRDRPTVLDFGIARVAHGAQSVASGQGRAGSAHEATVAGSPHYLAPEQLEGGHIDQRTDVYALGVVLYELLAGRKAFEGESLEQIVTAVQHANPAPANELRGDVPAGLAAVAARAMARDPADRHRSAAELAQALRPWQERSPQDEMAASVAPEPSGQHKSRVAALARRPLMLGTVAIAVVLVGAAGLMLSGVDHEAAAANPSPSPAVAAAALTPLDVAVAVGAAESASSAAGLGTEAAAETGGPNGSGTDALPPPTGTDAAQPKPKAKTRPARNTARSPAAGPSTATPAPTPAAPLLGVVRIAVSPWGEVEVNGQSAGITPPLVRLNLAAGEHEITIRNGDFPPYTTRVRVDPEQPTMIRHRFGS
jgi:serine/threonine-protein kinase